LEEMECRTSGAERAGCHRRRQGRQGGENEKEGCNLTRRPFTNREGITRRAIDGMNSLVALQPFIVSALTGFVSGLLLSIPVGPVNLTIINEGARRGLYWALLISLGASVMEVI